ncbi:DnaB helicase C-terminal domain-containing protein [Vibrio tubiashii]|uniref:DnaB helicase C-terminal domain-containing protein n=1 Tax=Vibrio tubiashii TaxID=29498 RepID=UPI001EFCA70D|nr:DnaB helicase C-terminal domain-containing protein [Vibrio tubiashii]MCG9575389.1 DnaB helicase C-terminal domain-containing protein [Vibrio tubiashii]
MKIVTTTEIGMESALAKLEKAYKGQENKLPDLWASSCSTGYPDLDKLTGGLNSGLIVVAGRTLHGAEVLHRNLFENAMLELGCAAENDKKALFFNTSMSSDDFYMQVLSSLSRVKLDTLMKGSLSDEDWSRVSSTMGLLMENQPLLTANQSTLYIEDVESICNEAIEQYGQLPVVAFDSLQAIRSRKSCDNRYAEIAEITRTLKAMSVKLDTRLIVKSSLNRNLEQRADKRPVLFDLRDSGTIEDDATLVIFSYLNSVYNPDECFDGASLMEAITAKSPNGSVGTTTLLHNAPFSRVDDYCEPKDAEVVEFPSPEEQD